MPIYEYACENCGCNLEVFQGMNDIPLTLCGKCNQHSLVKLVSAAGFRLKGGGWYETDFKKEGDKKKNLATEESSSSVSASSMSQNSVSAAPSAPVGTSTSSSVSAPSSTSSD